MNEIIVGLAILASPVILGFILSIAMDVYERIEFERFLYGEDEG